MQILVRLIERKGKLLTQVIEWEGAMRAVRNYATPAEAIVYLNKQALMYAQPSLEANNLQEGRTEVNEEGENVLVFGNLQSAIAHLTKAISAKVEPKVEPKEKVKKTAAKPEKKKSV